MRNKKHQKPVHYGVFQNENWMIGYVLQENLRIIKQCEMFWIFSQLSMTIPIYLLSVIKKELCYHNLSGNNKIVVLITLLSSSFYINFGPKQISHKLDFLIEFLNN